MGDAWQWWKEFAREHAAAVIAGAFSTAAAIMIAVGFQLVTPAAQTAAAIRTVNARVDSLARVVGDQHKGIHTELSSQGATIDTIANFTRALLVFSCIENSARDIQLAGIECRPPLDANRPRIRVRTR